MLLNVHVPDASGGVVQVPRSSARRAAARQRDSVAASARSPALASRARARRPDGEPWWVQGHGSARNRGASDWRNGARRQARLSPPRVSLGAADSEEQRIEPRAGSASHQNEAKKRKWSLRRRKLAPPAVRTAAESRSSLRLRCSRAWEVEIRRRRRRSSAD